MYSVYTSSLIFFPSDRPPNALGGTPLVSSMLNIPSLPSPPLTSLIYFTPIPLHSLPLFTSIPLSSPTFTYILLPSPPFPISSPSFPSFPLHSPQLLSIPHPFPILPPPSSFPHDFIIILLKIHVPCINLQTFYFT